MLKNQVGRLFNNMPSIDQHKHKDIQRHGPWFYTTTRDLADANNRTVQAAAFEYGEDEARQHKVFVKLEADGGNSFFSSFRNMNEFWRYYSEYSDKRCFYWINRSVEIKRVKSILYLDIEWVSSQLDRDDVDVKLAKIKTTLEGLLKVFNPT
jgi:hypothetical protein